MNDTSYNHPPKIGVLITNLGTPDSPTPLAVKKYLAEFLWDPYVVQIPKPIWWLILNAVILRRRPKKSAELYKKIWTHLGSPLLVLTSKLLRRLQVATTKQGCPFIYELGMRYGNPSIKQALLNLQKQQIQNLIVLPLYPQYSKTTTASTFAEIRKQLALINWHPKLHLIENYAEEPSYLSALALSVQTHWEKHSRGQKLLFSFHGIPSKNIEKGDPYYDQCLSTAHKVAALLNINEQQFEIVFQSRFGREKWLQPYCIDVLQKLPKEGYQHIDVICPGFAVDCLETLEEMAIANKEIFHKANGLTYHYIPALNDTNAHIQSLAEILIKNATLSFSHRRE